MEIEVHTERTEDACHGVREILLIRAFSSFLNCYSFVVLCLSFHFISVHSHSYLKTFGCFQIYPVLFFRLFLFVLNAVRLALSVLVSKCMGSSYVFICVCVYSFFVVFPLSSVSIALNVVLLTIRSSLSLYTTYSICFLCTISLLYQRAICCLLLSSSLCLPRVVAALRQFRLLQDPC